MAFWWSVDIKKEPLPIERPEEVEPEGSEEPVENSEDVPVQKEVTVTEEPLAGLEDSEVDHETQVKRSSNVSRSENIFDEESAKIERHFDIGEVVYASAHERNCLLEQGIVVDKNEDGTYEVEFHSRPGRSFLRRPEEITKERTVHTSASPQSSGPPSSAPSSTSSISFEPTITPPAVPQAIGQIRDYEKPLELNRYHTRRDSLDRLELKQDPILVGLFESIDTYDECLLGSFHVYTVTYEEMIDLDEKCMVITSQAIYFFPPLLEVENRTYLISNDYIRIPLEDLLTISLPYREQENDRGDDYALRMNEFCLHTRYGETTFVRCEQNRSDIVELVSECYELFWGSHLTLNYEEYDTLQLQCLNGDIWYSVREWVLEEWAMRPLVKQGFLLFQSKQITKKKFVVKKRWKKKWICLSALFMAYFDSEEDMHEFRYQLSRGGKKRLSAKTKYGDDNLIPLFSFSLEHSPLSSTDMVIISKHRELPWWNKKGSLRGYAFQAESESEILDWIQAIRCRRMWGLKLCRHMGVDTLDIVKPRVNQVSFHDNIECEECVNSVNSDALSSDETLRHIDERNAHNSTLGVDSVGLNDDSFDREIQSAAEVPPPTIRSILEQDEINPEMGIDHNERFRIKIENENRDVLNDQGDFLEKDDSEIKHYLGEILLGCTIKV